MFAVSDTLNHFNQHHKKDGFWLCYLDSALNLVDDSANACFYAFDKYDNGKMVFDFKNINPPSAKYFRLVYEGEKTTKGKPILLNGKFTWYFNYGVDSNLVYDLEIYKNGHPFYWNAYHRFSQDTLSGFNEILYFDRLYNGIDGTYYYEETDDIPGNTPGPVVTYSGYFMKGKKGWRVYGKETPGIKEKYGITRII
jgi:hypothetical protein